MAGHSEIKSISGFLLTRQWRDTTEGIQLNLWFSTDLGPRQVKIFQQEAVFFCRQSDIGNIQTLLTSSNPSFFFRIGDAEFKNFRAELLLPIYFKSHRHLREAHTLLTQNRISVWEADVRPPERYLMERFITASASIEGKVINNLALNPKLRANNYRPKLKIVSLDIETNFKADELYSIAVFNEDIQKVFMVDAGSKSSPSDKPYVICHDERDCLKQFFSWLQDYDPDIVIGWNVIQFDFWVLVQICRRLNTELDIARGGDKIHWRTDDSNNRHYLQVPGRIVLDGIEVLRGATFNFPSYTLNFVAKELLGEGKLLEGGDRGEEITVLFQQDKNALAAYNLKDCELVWDIFKTAKLMEYVIERSQLTGLLMDRVGGSVAAFEYLYLPQLHRKGYIAPNLGELQSSLMSPGGYVLNSQPGIYRNVLVLDFKSLYPSIIRTFRIDPYGYWAAQHQTLTEGAIVPGKRGAKFTKQDSILPTIIEQLWDARDRAKKEHNQPLSQAIKIIMNSFYGVLGSTGCRFYDPKVCSSITLRGHEIIQQTKTWIEEAGYSVIYGDTDSVFVWVGNEREEGDACAIGNQLAETLNSQWQTTLRSQFDIDCALELEFETHYLQFLMPTIRNSNQGSKKRYAGTVKQGEESKIVFKGLENVRTDWTNLAKGFQEEVFRRVFAEEPVEDYIRQVFESVRNGLRDKDLHYRKRLRRNVPDYKKNIPPHVQAAKKLMSWTSQSLKRGDWIEYIVTINGPEPVLERRSPIDYQHYIDRQLAPVADGVLQFVNLSFGRITAQQQDLFH